MRRPNGCVCIFVALVQQIVHHLALLLSLRVVSLHSNSLALWTTNEKDKQFSISEFPILKHDTANDLFLPECVTSAQRIHIISYTKAPESRKSLQFDYDYGVAFRNFQPLLQSRHSILHIFPSSLHKTARAITFITDMVTRRSRIRGPREGINHLAKFFSLG